MDTRRSRAHSLALGVVLAACTSACAFGPGDSFGELHPALSVAWSPLADRDAGQGFQDLDTDFEVRVDALDVTLSGIDLLDLGASLGSFDPASPPPGYTLCHNGHCHATDGRLVPYEEVAAELGGGGGLETAVSLLIEEDVDVLAGWEDMPACDPGCSLGHVNLVRARAVMPALFLAATVRDGRATPRFAGEVLVTLAVDLAALAAAEVTVGSLEAELDVEADRAHAPHIDLALAITFEARLFDGLDFAAAERNAAGGIDLGAPANAALLAELAINLGEMTMTATVEREGRAD